ncbi:hypothetical protein PENTCL1PPCAC_1577, partial [Pristionchus entomophagus]
QSKLTTSHSRETPATESAKAIAPEKRLERLPEKLSFAYNEFALSLLRVASGHDKNFVISPFSLGVALAMTHAGAKKETQE